MENNKYQYNKNIDLAFYFPGKNALKDFAFNGGENCHSSLNMQLRITGRLKY